MQNTTPNPISAELLTEIEAFCARENMAATAFGVAAVNDPNFVNGLRNGREPRWKTIQAVHAFMADAKGRAV